MEPIRVVTCLAAVLVGGGAAPLLGHHGSSAFNKQRPMSIDGIITAVDWVNPHVYLYVDVPDENGAAQNWAVECLSSEAMRRAGIRGFGRGTHISLSIYAPLSSAALANKVGPEAARERLQSGHYVAGGCATTDIVHERIGYGPPCPRSD